MGEVTIDSIQIEIESNSTNASKGLDALAGSLEKLDVVLFFSSFLLTFDAFCDILNWL